MSGDIEAIGVLATGGLIAHAMAPDHGHAGEDLHSCQNCGAALAGPFCHACGQSGHVHRTLSHVVEEFAHGVFHVESKGWRTLPMLVVNPGRLTREYIHGRRARYIAPLALILFMVFLTFAAFGLFGGSAVSLGGDGGRSVVEAKAALADVEKERAKAAADPEATDAERAALAVAADATRTAVAEAQRNRAPIIRTRGGAEVLTFGPGWADTVKRAVERGDIHIRAPTPELTARIRRALLDPEFTAYKVEHLASKLSFLLVPMTLPVLWLLFARRKGINLYDHTVFALYSLSFMSLLTIVLMLLSGAPSWMKPVAAPILLIPPVHMFAQLKGAYRLTMPGALWRTAVLSIASLVVLSIFLTLMLLIGLID